MSDIQDCSDIEDSFNNEGDIEITPEELRMKYLYRFRILQNKYPSLSIPKIDVLTLEQLELLYQQTIANIQSQERPSQINHEIFNEMINDDLLRCCKNQELLTFYNFCKQTKIQKKEGDDLFLEILREEGRRLLGELLPGRIVKCLLPHLQEIKTDPGLIQEKMKTFSSSELKLTLDFVFDIFALAYEDYKEELPDDYKIFYYMLRISDRGNNIQCNIL